MNPCRSGVQSVGSLTELFGLLADWNFSRSGHFAALDDGASVGIFARRRRLTHRVRIAAIYAVITQETDPT